MKHAHGRLFQPAHDFLPDSRGFFPLTDVLMMDDEENSVVSKAGCCQEENALSATNLQNYPNLVTP